MRLSRWRDLYSEFPTGLEITWIWVYKKEYKAWKVFEFSSNCTKNITDIKWTRVFAKVWKSSAMLQEENVAQYNCCHS